MNKSIILAIVTLVAVSCSRRAELVQGVWEVSNVNSADTSTNRETLLGSFMATRGASLHRLEFKRNGDLLFLGPDEQELGKGHFEMDGDSNITIQAPGDTQAHLYRVVFNSDNRIALQGEKDGESLSVDLARTTGEHDKE